MSVKKTKQTNPVGHNKNPKQSLKHKRQTQGSKPWKQTSKRRGEHRLKYTQRTQVKPIKLRQTIKKVGRKCKARQTQKVKAANENRK